MRRNHQQHLINERIHHALADGQWHTTADIRRHLPDIGARELGGILADGARTTPRLWQRASLGDRNMYAALPPVTAPAPTPQPPRRPRPRSTPQPPSSPPRILPAEIHHRAQQAAPRYLTDRTRRKWERMQAENPLFEPPMPLDTPPPPHPPQPLRIPPIPPRWRTQRQRRAQHYRNRNDTHREGSDTDGETASHVSVKAQ